MSATPLASGASMRRPRAAQRHSFTATSTNVSPGTPVTSAPCRHHEAPTSGYPRVSPKSFGVSDSVAT